jgi:phage FluMu gp28-like protein
MTASRTPYFLPYQQRWLADDSRLKIGEKSRRIGWTYTQAYEDVRDAAKEGGMDVWFTSADLTAAREYIRYVQMWARILNVVALDLGEVVLQGEGDTAIRAFTVEFANGKRISALSSNPKGFRSKGGKVVIDEFGFHENADELWRAAAPSVLWGYPIRVFSSHNGKGNRFYRMIEDARQGNDWSLHTCTIEDAIHDGLVERIKGLERPATDVEREDFRRECRAIAGDEETYQQEFLCNPMDGSSAYIPYPLIYGVEDLTLAEPVIVKGPDVHQIALADFRPTLPLVLRPGAAYYLGVDIGRKHDLTVAWLFEMVGDVLVTVLVLELHAMKFRYQFAYLSLILPFVQAAQIDETGLGMQLAEDSREDFGDHIEPVTFNLASKQDLAVGAKRAFEDRTIRIPKSDTIRQDITKIKRTVTPSGNVQFAGEQDANGHADRWWSLALARRAAVAGAVPYASGHAGGGRDLIGREGGFSMRPPGD